MRVNKRPRSIWAGAAALAVCVALTTTARAVPVVYDIDPTQSSVTLVVTVFPVTPQVPGADIDAVDGTISADLTAGVLTFSGGSVLDWVPNPVAASNPASAFNPAGQFAPGFTFLPPFTSGTEDNYGVNSGAVGPIAVRNLMADIATGTVQHGLVPAGMTGTFTSGFLDNAGFDATPSIAGSGWTNTTALVASLTTVGNVETLTLPIIFKDSGNTASFGTIVATRVVAEPSTLVMTGLGLVGLAVVVRKRRGK